MNDYASLDEVWGKDAMNLAGETNQVNPSEMNPSKTSLNKPLKSAIKKPLHEDYSGKHIPSFFKPTTQSDNFIMSIQSQDDGRRASSGSRGTRDTSGTATELLVPSPTSSEHNRNRTFSKAVENNRQQLYKKKDNNDRRANPQSQTSWQNVDKFSDGSDTSDLDPNNFTLDFKNNLNKMIESIVDKKMQQHYLMIIGVVILVVIIYLLIRKS